MLNHINVEFANLTFLTSFCLSLIFSVDLRYSSCLKHVLQRNSRFSWCFHSMYAYTLFYTRHSISQIKINLSFKCLKSKYVITCMKLCDIHIKHQRWSGNIINISPNFGYISNHYFAHRQP